MWGKCVRERESEEKETVRDGGGSKMRERGDNERERVGVVDGRVQCDAWDVCRHCVEGNEGPTSQR